MHTYMVCCTVAMLIDLYTHINYACHKQFSSYIYNIRTDIGIAAATLISVIKPQFNCANNLTVPFCLLCA